MTLPGQVFVGAGMGFAGDRTDAAGPVAAALARMDGPRFLIFETLAERTLALAQVERRRDPARGYIAGLPGFIGPVLRQCAEHGIRIVGNFGAANPREGFVGDPEAGIFYHPTFVTGVTLEDEIYSTETFGPLVGVARFSRWEEAIELANCHCYGLSSAIYTTSPTHAFRFREQISAGMVSINNSTSGAEAHLPFGGNGKSGNGSRQSGVWVPGREAANARTTRFLPTSPTPSTT